LKGNEIIEEKKARGITNPRLLSLKAASLYSGLTIWALRERIWAGDLPVVRFNGCRKMFVDTQDVEALIESNKVRIT
jgi:hypothetical protein